MQVLMEYYEYAEFYKNPPFIEYTTAKVEAPHPNKGLWKINFVAFDQISNLGSK